MQEESVSVLFLCSFFLLRVDRDNKLLYCIKQIIQQYNNTKRAGSNLSRRIQAAGTGKQEGGIRWHGN